MNGDGADAFGKVSTRLNQNRIDGLTPRDQFAFVLDGNVISAPRMNSQISTESRASRAASHRIPRRLSRTSSSSGALPLSFTVQSSDTISATLGTQQLQIGLIAGLIGLALVAIYSLIVYRALGSVIIASIAVMAILTYIIICILAWRIGFRLSLAGVAGLIVSIGFTADSFIVYFERIRDELRDGKSITSAVEDGRVGPSARSTSRSPSTSSRRRALHPGRRHGEGFAFTLGLTTLIGVFIFVIFTHPVMQLLARTRFFGGGHKLSGLDPGLWAPCTAAARSIAR